MATRRTWIWIVVAVMAAGLVAVIGIAGAGIYFVSKRVQSATATAPEAVRSFDEVTKSFRGNHRALYELSGSQEPQLTKPFSSIPTSPTKATDLWVQAWDPDDERLVKLSLPLWLLRYGDRKMRVLKDEGGFPLRELTLDADELSRIGPSIVLDYRRANGLRVLLWTR
jgi:hypothetical protein